MQHKIKILASLFIASVTANSFAATEVLNGSFDTIKAVSITETTALSFTGLTLATNDACVMTASSDGSGTGYLGDVFMRLGSANANATGATANTMDACVGSGTAAIGVYEIDGAAGATVNVTITNGSNADVSVTPVGCIGNYVDGVDGDSCAALAVATNAGVTPIRHAGTGDTGSLGEGTPIAGTSLIALGGTITAEQTLTAGTPYSVDFTIDVAY
mmetsp:Transcript_12759/g.19293  ORF Transcript_12759/g.19293 Transcript_12759/m.19293 type:complete len:216 (+) Transcript_12759:78-725(+)